MSSYIPLVSDLVAIGTWSHGSDNVNRTFHCDPIDPHGLQRLGLRGGSPMRCARIGRYRVFSNVPAGGWVEMTSEVYFAGQVRLFGWRWLVRLRKPKSQPVIKARKNVQSSIRWTLHPLKSYLDETEAQNACQCKVWRTSPFWGGSVEARSQQVVWLI